MTHRIEDHGLPGINSLRRARLLEAGIETLEQLTTTPLPQLLSLTGLPEQIVERAQQAAMEVLHARPTPPPPPLVDVVETSPPAGPAQDPPSAAPAASGQTDAVASSSPPVNKPLRRGLDAARRLEISLDCIRRCRAHARTCPESLHADTARRELKRLRAMLEKAQREALTHGLSRRTCDDLFEQLDRYDERFERYLAKRARPNRTLKLAKRARKARLAMEQRLG